MLELMNASRLLQISIEKLGSISVKLEAQKTRSRCRLRSIMFNFLRVCEYRSSRVQVLVPVFGLEFIKFTFMLNH